MDEEGMDQIYQLRAQVLKAMAHPARLKMIDALVEEEICVCDLAELVDLAVPTVSRHLKKMKAAGIVDTRKDGNHVYYHLEVPCVIGVFECIDDVLRADDEQLRQMCRMLDGSS